MWTYKWLINKGLKNKIKTDIVKIVLESMGYTSGGNRTTIKQPSNEDKDSKWEIEIINDA